jgi:hypothetical protein
VGEQNRCFRRARSRFVRRRNVRTRHDRAGEAGVLENFGGRVITQHRNIKRTGIKEGVAFYSCRHASLSRTPVTLGIKVSFPKIISARSDDAVHPRRAQQRRYQTVGLLDAVAHPCAVIGACAIHYSRWRTCSEFASGAPRQRSASDPGTRGAPCRSGVPHTRFARAS